MQSEEIPSKVKKNLLDLEYSKYLQYLNTSIIVLFTYIVGIAIACITKQIDYSNTNQLLLVVLISIAISSIIVILLLRFKEGMLDTMREIEKLKL